MAGLSTMTTAHVGRISTQDQMWHWSKQFWEASSYVLNTITALAIDPAGTKLVCHGAEQDGDMTTRYTSNKKQGYLFVLDVASGEIVSGLMEMVHDLEYTVNSAGMLLYDNGMVYFAEDYRGLSRTIPSGIAQMPRIGAWDSTTNTMIYHKQVFQDGSGEYGVSGSLVQGTGSYNYMYMGGS